jgi:hypothetical protein
MPSARSRLVFFSAAIAALTAILAVIMPAGIASAATGTAAETRVWALSPAAQVHVRADGLVSAGERPGEAASCPFCMSGACVAAEAVTGGAASVAKGEVGVQQSIAAAEARGETVLGREITMETSGARVRPDILAQDAEGNLKFIEAKNGPFASLTPNQQVGYPLLESEGGIPRGMNAFNAGLTPGEPLGPTPVQIDWWNLP